MRIGSLFSGAGGLDMAVEAVFGGRTVWHSEIDKAASKVLAYRFPGVPNLGSITDIDWATVEPVDVLCGGFPCQDVSAAGKRAGIKDGTRSGLWAIFAEAIDVLRPRFVVIENVRGLLSATAHRAVESGDAIVGDRSDRPVLRALGAVLGDLSDLRYDARWATAAASAVGAPHRRERIFILAHPAGRVARDGWAAVAERARGAGGDEEQHGVRAGVGAAGEPGVGARGGAVGGGAAAVATRNGWDEGRPESARIVGGSDAAVGGDEPGVALLPTPRTSDTNGAGHHGDGGMDLRTTVTLLPTPRVRHGDSSESGLRRNSPGIEAVTYHFPDQQWGKYAPAIRRWEQIVGPAPAPTEPNKNGNPRLSAAFSEWLMGWPAGWVTDPAIGISRNDQLRIVGNGVCTQQAIAALRFLLAVTA